MRARPIVALTLALTLSLAACGHSARRPSDRPIRHEDQKAATGALKQIHAPAGFRDTWFACAKAEDIPSRCFKTSAVMPRRSQVAAEQLVRSFGLTDVELRCDVSPPAMASTSTQLNCHGAAYLGHFTVAAVMRSGENRAKPLSGTWVALAIVRVRNRLTHG